MTVSQENALRGPYTVNDNASEKLAHHLHRGTSQVSDRQCCSICSSMSSAFDDMICSEIIGKDRCPSAAAAASVHQFSRMSFRSSRSSAIVIYRQHDMTHVSAAARHRQPPDAGRPHCSGPMLETIVLANHKRRTTASACCTHL